MKKTRLTLIFLLLILGITMISAENTKEKNMNSICINACNVLRNSSLNACKEVQSNRTSKCYDNFNSCFKKANDEFINNSINIDQFFINGLKCLMQMKECYRSREDLARCNNQATREFNGCKKNCSNKEKACIALYAPVCGVDGKTYSNSCVAKCAKVEYTEGECKNETICKKEGETGHLNQKPNCCDGLTAITKSDKEESCDKETGICRIETGGDYICTKCGDSICGIGENNYNCPKDCTNSGKSPLDQLCVNGKCKDNKTDCEFDYDCPINNPNNFSCPVNNRVNCMPPILENNKDYCSGDYYLWIKKNCKVSFSY